MNSVVCWNKSVDGESHVIVSVIDVLAIASLVCYFLRLTQLASDCQQVLRTGALIDSTTTNLIYCQPIRVSMARNLANQIAFIARARATQRIVKLFVDLGDSHSDANLSRGCIARTLYHSESWLCLLPGTNYDCRP